MQKVIIPDLTFNKKNWVWVLRQSLPSKAGIRTNPSLRRFKCPLGWGRWGTLKLHIQIEWCISCESEQHNADTSQENRNLKKDKLHLTFITKKCPEIVLITSQELNCNSKTYHKYTISTSICMQLSNLGSWRNKNKTNLGLIFITVSHVTLI